MATQSKIPKSGYRFSEKIMLKQKVGRDDDSKKNHPALASSAWAPALRGGKLLLMVCGVLWAVALLQQ